MLVMLVKYWLCVYNSLGMQIFDFEQGNREWKSCFYLNLSSDKSGLGEPNCLFIDLVNNRFKVPGSDLFKNKM